MELNVFVKLIFLLFQALSLIILELNYSKPHEGKRQNIQVTTYLIFVIFFTWTKFLKNKIYTKNANFSR